MLYRLVMCEAYLSEQIQTKKCEHYNPYCKINLSVEDAPVVSLVGNAEELESESDFNESEYDFY